jgi:hypothetical protein
MIKTFGGAGDDAVGGLAVDRFENIFLGGTFKGRGNFDPNGTSTLGTPAALMDSSNRSTAPATSAGSAASVAAVMTPSTIWPLMIPEMWSQLGATSVRCAPMNCSKSTPVMFYLLAALKWPLR